MSLLGRGIFCRCSSAGLVVRVVTVLLISFLATVGREELDMFLRFTYFLMLCNE